MDLSFEIFPMVNVKCLLIKKLFKSICINVMLNFPLCFPFFLFNVLLEDVANYKVTKTFSCFLSGTLSL